MLVRLDFALENSEVTLGVTLVLLSVLERVHSGLVVQLGLELSPETLQVDLSAQSGSSAFDVEKLIRSGWLLGLAEVADSPNQPPLNWLNL
jgi:hypothetical protein